ncbi:DNA (cytosine-5)-methyltransferase domain-containing protein [Cryptosporidium serpentis]
MLNLTCLDGIGGLHLSLKYAVEKLVEHGQAMDIKVIKAFEINENCNNVYKRHFKDTPICTKNIESLNIDDIPKANIWLLSPPCQPFTRGGAKRDSDDNRCKPFLKVIDLMYKIDVSKMPSIWFIENVINFEQSRTHKFMIDMFNDLDYTYIQFLLSPTLLNIPNTRVRYYCMAFRCSNLVLSCKYSILSRYEDFIASNILRNNCKGTKKLEYKLIINDPQNKYTYDELLCHLPYSSKFCFKLLHSHSKKIGDIIYTVKSPLFFEMANKVIDRNNSFRFDLVNELSIVSTTITKSYAESAGRSGPLFMKGSNVNNTKYNNGYLSCDELSSVYKQIFDTSELCPSRFQCINEVDLSKCNIRFLQPSEILSLMGFPSDWLSKIYKCDSLELLKQQYSLIGNSISIHVVSILMYYMIDLACTNKVLF